MAFLKSKIRNQIHPLPEVLVNNVVDEDIQSLLAPMNFMQTIFLLPKYKIRDNLITPNGFWSNLICFIGVCSFISLYFYNMSATKDLMHTATLNFVQRGLVVDFIYFSIGSIMNCLVCTLQSKWYVQLVLMMQESHRSLYDRKFRILVKRNWFYIIALVSFYLLNGIFVQLTFFNEISMTNVASTISVVMLDFNLVSAIRLIIFINVMFELWVKKFKFYSKATVCTHERLKSELLWKKMYYTYSCVMKSYNLLKKVFQWLILYHVAETFFHSLLYVQVLIEFTKLPSTKWDQKFTYVMAAQFNLWLMKNLVLHNALAIAFEKFYMIQANAEDACSMVEARCPADSYKKSICKNVRRLRTSEVVKFKLGRLFLVDAKYPLRLLSLISTYTIVLLQFGYL